MLALHGGRPVSRAPVRGTRLAYRRMFPLARAGHRSDVSVWVLRNRVRGWNEPALDAVCDARRAIEVIRGSHRGARIALLGHSMGGRVALRLAGEPDVVGVCALAPWTTEDDAVEQLTGRIVRIVHGDRDRTIPPETSLAYARRARRAGAAVSRHVIGGSGHAMLRRAEEWNAQVAAFALDCAAAWSPR
ncbi:alpha/beta fold hydrolase [Saccharopolyspora sp. TS4A08]|uniref:Alpha/beta fold hydrolase n=1 Tax=Saccharopolyspora ipomoeae TaxID=3042027 RepID=A0ABT6PLT2_9PSEU|nr:alpha/beta fold hydrolase [Saccharopolyspora sp. TS4A08]MDI2028882.1 alpha/beta fold hydrolase [Saccharopolyspora sp. TS4A08]